MRVAALVKQIPKFENLTLGPDGRLERAGLELHLNDYCRRAVAKGVELADLTGGTCVVITLGPPSADTVLRDETGAHRGGQEGAERLIADPAHTATRPAASSWAWRSRACTCPSRHRAIRSSSSPPGSGASPGRDVR